MLPFTARRTKKRKKNGNSVQKCTVFVLGIVDAGIIYS